MAAVEVVDVTTLNFESKDEDKLRKVGMSRAYRVCPQVQVGLLVDPVRLPLHLHIFEGNKAETTTIIPVKESFQQRHGVTDLVVFANAGMLSANSLNTNEDAGFRFIVGSCLTTAPYDRQKPFDSKGNRYNNGQILEFAREMGAGKTARERRTIFQW